MSVLIIAEAGINHNGDVELAKKMVLAASFAGADIIKFQTCIRKPSQECISHTMRMATTTYHTYLFHKHHHLYFIAKYFLILSQTYLISLSFKPG